MSRKKNDPLSPPFTLPDGLSVAADTVRNKTENALQNLEEELECQRYEAVVEAAHDGIITVDKQLNIRLINLAARDIFLLGDRDVTGMSLTQLIPLKFQSKHSEYAADFFDSSIQSRAMQSRAPVRGLRADGSEFSVEVSLSKIEVGGEVEVVAMIRDLSERARLIDELAQAASFDALTGIVNRRYASTALVNELMRCKRFNRVMSIAMFDLDHFKDINDRFGHPFGDTVLKSVVNTVSETLRATDLFCRWGGEEFIVLLPETSYASAMIWAQRACRMIGAVPVMNDDDQPVSVTASFGVVETNGRDTIEQVISRVDQALYRAKDKGRNCICGDEL
ncbi:MAG: GGDEF domain-containing protein [Betaproteobacteria bacterium]|nr:GGDEF domain-containing protein [Betaproteobacteria bacterium]